ncbi:MAG TPA: penicillin-binding transpeptidase domain-containing protein [Marinagarivorans sp.]
MSRIAAHWRFAAICLVIALLPTALVWHLSYLQVMPGQEKGHDFLQAQGQARTLREQKINAYRGVISDRNGELLAVSTPVISIAVNPQVISPQGVRDLANALGLPLRELNEKLQRYANKQFMYVARQLPPFEAAAATQLKIRGVIAEREYRRFYPAGEVAAHVVGFTSIDDQGQEGMELALDDYLAGTAGVQRVIKDLKGNIVKDLGIVQAASPGGDVQLSIDLRLQYLAYRELKNAIAKQRAKSGSIVMLDVETGEILAMVNQPSYNPNDRKNIKASEARNRAMTDVIEPGSTVKPFTVMAALETGRYNPDSVINTNPGHVRVGRKTFLDPKNYGEIDLGTVIQKSSQVGISKLALDLPQNVVRNMFERLGFGQSTGTGFPGESLGVLPSRQKWHPIETATLAFGYGLTVTPLQLAQSYVTVASSGRSRPVSLLKQDELPPSTQVIDPVIADQIAAMLKRVTERGGTATQAQTSAYLTAGKTGTAHKVGKHGYADDKYVATFAGMAPADDPKVVTVVVINEPTSGRYYGGEAAAPVFASVTDSSLRLLNIPPNNSRQSMATSRVAKR